MSNTPFLAPKSSDLGYFYIDTKSFWTGVIVYYTLLGHWFEKNNPPNPRSYGIYKAERISGVWEISNITAGLEVHVENGFNGLPGPVTDVVVDPVDPDNIWVTIGSFSEGNKVFNSKDGGGTWVNQTNCLPNVPFTTLVFQRGSDDNIYLGSDIGVFYRQGNDPNEDWYFYGEKGPRCLISDLEINNCSQKLVASTLGRGLWEVPLMTPPELVISENTSWDNDKFLTQNLRIQSGATLTVLNAEIRIAEDIEIFVERGAKLVSNLSHWKASCDTRWGGIHIHGNAGLPQPDPQSNPSSIESGIVIMNESIVEDAGTAITTQAPDKPEAERADYYGGLIVANGTTFKNNWRAVEFMRYPFDNKSFFHGCTFDGEPDVEINNSRGVTIWACEGIEFTQNRFENFDLEGILGINFGALVYDGNHFENCRTAGIANMSTNGTIIMELIIGSSTQGHARNTFVDNGQVHIEVASASGNMQILNNDFLGSSVGVRVVGNSDNLWIMGNIFQDQRAFSCRVQDSGLGNNLVECNQFMGRNFMALAMMGNNEKTQCIGNDFNIENAFANVVVSGKIREYQGDPNLNLQADNCFDPSAPQDIRTMPSALPFEYILLQGDLSCHRPDNTGQNYTILELINAQEQACLDVRQGVAGNINKLISIQADIAQLESNSPNLSASEKYFLVSLKSDFSNLESKLLEEALNIGNELMIENIISIPSSKENRDLISYYQQLGNLNKAQQEIAALPADQISVDFADIQLLFRAW